jgi:hypothetical protein
MQSQASAQFRTAGQRDAVLVHAEMDLHALDLLAAIKAAPEADLQDRLSMMTALGSALSPQASRQVRRNRSSKR